MYFINDFEIIPVVHITTGITFVFKFRMRCFSTVRSLNFSIFWGSFLTTKVTPEIAMSINRHVPCSLLRIMMYGLLLGIVTSVVICRFHVLKYSCYLAGLVVWCCGYQHFRRTVKMQAVCSPETFVIAY